VCDACRKRLTPLDCAEISGTQPVVVELQYAMDRKYYRNPNNVAKSVRDAGTLAAELVQTRNRADQEDNTDADKKPGMRP